MTLVGDFLIVTIDICLAILISLTTATLWTCAHLVHPDDEAEATNIETSSQSKQGRLQSGTTFSSLNEGKGSDAKNLWHIMPPDKIDDQPYPEVVSAEMMVVGIMKSKGIYDPYVFMGNWGGKHNEDTANGYLTLTSSKSGTCSTTDITLTISSAEYKNATKEEDLELDSGSTNTLVLTSNTPITTCGPHTLNRKTLTLTLKDADSSFNDKTYNVSLKIDGDITLTSCTSNCTLKKTTVPVSLGTYNITNSTGDSNTITGNPEENDMHSKHKNDKCCFFGNQYTWSKTNNRNGWHSFLILIPIKISLPLYLYTQFSTHYLTNSENVECNPKILRFGTSQSWDSYYTNRNTSVTNTNTNTIAGTKDTDHGKLRKLAKDLHEKANDLHSKASAGQGQQEAKNLAEAVGANESTGDKLRQKLKDLYDASDGELTTKAKAVKSKYDNVKGKFQEVEKKKDTYTEGKGKAEYQAVVEAWNAFNNVYNYVKFDKHVFDSGHERRRFNDAAKYDVGGDRLKKKAKELQTAAQALQEKANTESAGGGDLTTPAGDLATEAGKLAKGGNGTDATNVITKFNLLETEYNELGNTNQAKFMKEFENVKHIYDRMLNVTKAEKLKSQVGNGSSDGKILDKAKELYTKADELANAPGLTNQDLRELATSLANAVGATDSKGLQKALSELNSASESDKVEKALAVIKHYGLVESAYEKVKEKEGDYTKALTSAAAQYGQVTDAFGQLEGAYNKGKCKAIEKARQLKDTATTHSNNELTNARNADIQNNNKKGNELTSKAKELKNKADNLHGAAGELATDNGELSELKPQAGTLRDEAKGSGGLYGAANQLASHPTDGNLDGKATAVIQKFEAVRQAYKALMDKAKEIKQQNHSKVTPVETAYNELQDVYDQMLNLSKLAYYAQTLSDKAGEITGGGLTELSGPATDVKNAANGTGTDDTTSLHYHANQLAKAPNNDKAKAVITAFNKVAKDYTALASQQAYKENQTNPKVKAVYDAYNNLNDAYDNIGFSYKDFKFWPIVAPSIVSQWLNFVTYLVSQFYSLLELYMFDVIFYQLGFKVRKVNEKN